MTSRSQSLWLVAIDKIRLVLVVFFYFSKLAIVSYARVCEVISDHVTLDNFYLISRSRSTIFKRLPLRLTAIITHVNKFVKLGTQQLLRKVWRKFMNST